MPYFINDICTFCLTVLPSLNKVIILSYLILSYLILSYLILSYLILSMFSRWIFIFPISLQETCNTQEWLS